MRVEGLGSREQGAGEGDAEMGKVSVMLSTGGMQGTKTVQGVRVCGMYASRSNARKLWERE